MTFDPDHCVVLNINPQFAFKQILVCSFWHRLHYETAIRSYLLLAQQHGRVVFWRDGALAMLFASGGFDFARDERSQRQTTNESGPTLGCDDKSPPVGRVELHPADLRGVHFPF